MLALTYEKRAAKWPDDDDEADRQHKNFRRRYEKLARQILDRPITLSSIVDRALMMRFHEDAPDDLSGWMPMSAEQVDFCEDAANGHGLLAAVLALADLPVDWDGEASKKLREMDVHA
jgi:hypothetical protein